MLNINDLAYAVFAVENRLTKHSGNIVDIAVLESGKKYEYPVVIDLPDHIADNVEKYLALSNEEFIANWNNEILPRLSVEMSILITTSDLQKAIDVLKNDNLPLDFIFDMKVFSLYNGLSYIGCLLGLAVYLKNKYLFARSCVNLRDSSHAISISKYDEENNDLYFDVCRLIKSCDFDKTQVIAEWDRIINR